MRARREDIDYRFTVTLEDGPIRLGSNFVEPLSVYSSRMPEGYFQKTLRTNTGIIVVVTGLETQDNSARAIKVSVSQSGGLTKDDLVEAIGIIKSMGLLAKAVITKKPGFMRDFLEATLVEGKEIRVKAEPAAELLSEKKGQELALKTKKSLRRVPSLGRIDSWLAKKIKKDPSPTTVSQVRTLYESNLALMRQLEKHPTEENVALETSIGLLVKNMEAKNPGKKDLEALKKINLYLLESLADINRLRDVSNAGVMDRFPSLQASVFNQIEGMTVLLGGIPNLPVKQQEKAAMPGIVRTHERALDSTKLIDWRSKMIGKVGGDPPLMKKINEAYNWAAKMLDKPGAADSLNQAIQFVERECLKFEEKQQRNEAKNPRK